MVSVPTPRRVLLLLGLVAATSMAATLLAARRTSTTFDEIVMVAGGARGYATGAWDLAPEHPPLVQYLYGLPVHLLAAPTLPSASQMAEAERAAMSYRYHYAQTFYWKTGNDPERIAFLGRILAVLMVGLLTLATFLLTRPALGPWPALVAAALVAFLPDVVAHGGVAYNDLPAALTYLLAVYALDAAVRRPTQRRGVLAGLAVALALSIKLSAVVLGPVAALLLGAEAWRRRGDAAWRHAARRAVGAGALALYAGLVLTYRGDLVLDEFLRGMAHTFGHVTQGHGIPAYFGGQIRRGSWWWWYPAAFLYKTPAAFHVLLVVAAFGGGLAWWRERRSGGVRDEAASLLESPLRAPLAGLLVFAAALLTSNLAIGFRHALPVLPLLCILAAAGAARAWRARGRAMAVLVVALVVAHAASTLSWYPWFLSYVSEYAPARNQGHRVFVDSSVDWGQGLLALRETMAERGIERVYLSYFGSALPEGYGIDYVPLPSFFPLEAPPGSDPTAPPPEWAVVSASLLHPVYLEGSLVDRFTRMAPEAVVARTLFLYRLP
ncbi:MAG: glycosyltransferase family 39 protein [Gemmatimonadota bacterium]